MQPRDKLDNRVQNNFLSATAMLGHLCALYDQGVFEAARLMSNLLFQLAVQRKPTNTPLIEQVGLWDPLRVLVDSGICGSSVNVNDPSSPLVGLMVGLRTNAEGEARRVSMWLPGMRKPDAGLNFVSLTVDEWLNDPVIPTSLKVLSRRDLILAVRDQDGGAHSDSDSKLQKSIGYIELVNSFPIAKSSAVEINGETVAPAWEELPPVTLPILRQIAHEMRSAIYSQTDIRECFYLTGLVCIFHGTQLQGAFVPQGYPNIGPVHGRQPAVVSRPKA
jgi:hypothetical protein